MGLSAMFYTGYRAGEAGGVVVKCARQNRIVEVLDPEAVVAGGSV